MFPTETATPSANDVLAGLLTRAELARQLKRTERTVIRYERAGMPFIALGMLRLYEPAKVRNWLIGHERDHAEPRRGRPRKAA